jgi:hypothetical protein
MKKYLQCIQTDSKVMIPLIMFVLVLVGGWLRFYNLHEVPAGYTWDEAAITYDAWALSLSGKDHWGVSFPLSLKSFGDYKAPVFSYLMAGMFLFTDVYPGLIRIVAAFSGTMLILITFALTKSLFNNPPLALIAATLIAVSPWHIHISRVGFEAGLATTLLATSVYLFIQKKQWLITVSFIVFGLTFYTYHSSKIIITVLLPALLFLTRRDHIKAKLAGFLIFILMVTPFIMGIQDHGQRSQQTLLFFQSGKEWLAQFTEQFRRHFNLDFWLKGKGNVQHVVENFGILTPFEITGLLLSVILMIKQKRYPSITRGAFLLILLLLPSILSVESPHVLRSLHLLPFIQIASAIGIMALYRKRHLFLYAFIAMIATYTAVFYRDYHTNYSINAAPAFQYGYKDAMNVVAKEGKKAQHMVITDAYGQPYIYYLLYLKIPPQEFLAGATANVSFRPITYPLDQPDTLYVGTPEEIPEDDPLVITTIPYPGTDTKAFTIAHTPDE